MHLILKAWKSKIIMNKVENYHKSSKLKSVKWNEQESHQADKNEKKKVNENVNKYKHRIR